MTWSATYINAVPRDGRIAFSFLLTDGAQKVVVERVVDYLDDAVLQSAARAEAAARTLATSAQGKLTIAPGSLIDLTAPAAVSPTPEQLAQSVFLTEYGRLQALLRGLAAGITKQADADAQAEKVRAAYLPEYEALL